MASMVEKIILTGGAIGILGTFGSHLIDNKEVRDKVYEAGKVVTIFTGGSVIGYYSGRRENNLGSK